MLHITRKSLIPLARSSTSQLFSKTAFHTSLKAMSSTTPEYTDSKAIITYQSPDSKSLNWKYEPIKVRTTLDPNELLIDVKYVGICHTDVALGKDINQRPKILGHEGVGIVKSVGSSVKDHKVGDRVVLSYSYCDHCHYCESGNSPYCAEFITHNLADVGAHPTFISGADSKQVDGKFFGQSSFAKLSVVDHNSVVNLESLPKKVNDEQFKHLGPFGCGFQTGAGAALNGGSLKKGESVVIYGFGGVGFSALSAAKIGGASKIIVVDVLDSKLDLALKVGATHVIKATKGDEAVGKEIKEITDGRGADLSIECIGGPRFVENAIKNSAQKGKIVMLGIGKATDNIEIPLFDFLLSGKQLISCVEGDAKPQDFIPKMIGWYLDGDFPVDAITKFYKVEEFETALQDMKEGKVIKPILEF